MIATFWRGTFDAINRPACAHCSDVSLGRRPPIPPCARASSSPTFVQSSISSRFISTRAPSHGKIKKTIDVDVSMLPVRLRKSPPLTRSYSVSIIRCFLLLPNLSSFQTIKVSPYIRDCRAHFNLGRSEIVADSINQRLYSPALQRIW